METMSVKPGEVVLNLTEVCRKLVLALFQLKGPRSKAVI